jgi:hypothetical protein
MENIGDNNRNNDYIIGFNDEDDDNSTLTPPGSVQSTIRSHQQEIRFDPSRMIEFVGLKEASNGRTCTEHEVCGASVSVNDILRLRSTVVTIDGRVEPAIALVLVKDGVETCRVAFIPRVWMVLPKVRNNINKCVQVLKLYEQSDNTFHQSLDLKNGGMGVAVFIDDIPFSE